MSQDSVTKHRGGGISQRPYGVGLPLLREWRYFRAITQRELANAANTTGPLVSCIELGKTTSFSMVRRLAQALNVSVEQLRYEHPPHEQTAPAVRAIQH